MDITKPDLRNLDWSAWTAGRLGDDPVAAYLESAAPVTAAFADDDVFGRRVEVRVFGVFSGGNALSPYFVDFVACLSRSPSWRVV